MILEINFVGNKFLKRKPNKKDKNIKLIPEPENEYDNNAIAIYSFKKKSKVKLGYIPKYDNKRLLLLIETINNKLVLKGIVNNELYYTLIFESINN